MKKVIAKVEYDTDNAKLVKKYTEGNFGDPAGFEESLYETEGGKFFMYVNGGETSPYKSENIKKVTKKELEAFLNK